MDTAVEMAPLPGRVRSAVLEAVARESPAFAETLDRSGRFLSIAECVQVWNAVLDEVDFVLAASQDARSSPFFENADLIDEVLDAMSELKRVAIARVGAITGDRPALLGRLARRAPGAGPANMP